MISDNPVMLTKEPLTTANTLKVFLNSRCYFCELEPILIEIQVPKAITGVINPQFFLAAAGPGSGACQYMSQPRRELVTPTPTRGSEGVDN